MICIKEQDLFVEFALSSDNQSKRAMNFHSLFRCYAGGISKFVGHKTDYVLSRGATAIGAARFLLILLIINDAK